MRLLTQEEVCAVSGGRSPVPAPWRRQLDDPDHRSVRIRVPGNWAQGGQHAPVASGSWRPNPTGGGEQPRARMFGMWKLARMRHGDD